MYPPAETNSKHHHQDYSMTTQQLAINSLPIREQDGLYSLNDFHKASGGAVRHRPSEFLRLDKTKALVVELTNSPEFVSSIKGGAPHLFVRKEKGRAGSTFACRELAIAYASWISPAFQLKVIRVFLASVVVPATPHVATPANIDQLRRDIYRSLQYVSSRLNIAYEFARRVSEDAGRDRKREYNGQEDVYTLEAITYLIADGKNGLKEAAGSVLSLTPIHRPAPTPTQAATNSPHLLRRYAT
ncbi:hypothetical protein ADT28_02255 [Xylella fastidiosa]|uniref:Phage-related protein n=3 Tax=Xylella fastidiosa TaxID=2371 RepID=Q9PB51_XYLFA|nr:phage-related protein [Xylella fastidiosa 9a5c]KXB16412.1 hypothetical protein ADT29_01355 [Xylella fastidiosa]KXB22612.1 hypothetical protein ADT28_02255 [Xylella fastidiosa]